MTIAVTVDVEAPSSGSELGSGSMLMFTGAVCCTGAAPDCFVFASAAVIVHVEFAAVETV
jgi:hypothetical protein